METAIFFLFTACVFGIGWIFGYVIGVWKGFNVREPDKDKPC